jgi:hypothetical protein
MSKFSSYEKDKKIFDNWRQFVIKEQVQVSEEEKKALQDLKFGQKYAVEDLKDVKNVGGLLYFLTIKKILKVGQWDEVKTSLAQGLEKVADQPKRPVIGKLTGFLKNALGAGVAGATVGTLLTWAGATTLAAASAPAAGVAFVGLALLNQVAGDTVNKVVDSLFDFGLKTLANENKELLAQLIGQPDTGKGKNTNAPLIGLFDLDDDYQALARVVTGKNPDEYSDVEKESLQLFLEKIIKASIGNLDTTIEEISAQLNHDAEFKKLINKKLGIDVGATESSVGLYMDADKKKAPQK